MKKVTVFVITGCPYCAQARKALKELVSENPEYAKVEFEEINEMVARPCLSGKKRSMKHMSVRSMTSARRM